MSNQARPNQARNADAQHKDRRPWRRTGLGKALLTVKPFALAIVCGATALSTARAAGGNPDFTLRNRTGFAIWSIYVREYGDTDWGQDILPDLLGNGEATAVSLHSDACHWDVMIRYFGGDHPNWENLNLCSTNTLTLTWDSGSNLYTATRQ